MSTRDRTTPARSGLGLGDLFLGLLALVLLLTAVGSFGVGAPELLIWLALVAGWVTFWTRHRRRRPGHGG